MSALGLNLLLALVVLSPGLAVHLAAFGPGRSLFRSPPPAPNSVAALAIVTLGAVTAHTIANLALVINDVIAENSALSHLQLPFDPNVYRTALAAARHGGEMDAPALTSLLVFSLLLCGASYTAASLALQVEVVRDYVARALFGWAAQLPQGIDDRVVIAFVLTDTEIEGSHVGYEGVLLDVGLDSDRSIKSVLLTGATLFHLRQTRDHVRRVVDPRVPQIELLHVEGSRIRNVAFTIVDIEAA